MKKRTLALDGRCLLSWHRYSPSGSEASGSDSKMLENLTVSCRSPQGTLSALCVLIAMASLALGIVVYVVDRPPASVYFLPYIGSLAHAPKLWFGVLGDQIPELAHVYAFILLTAAVTAWPVRLWLLCAVWLVIELLFEIGQYPAFAVQIAAALPRWFQEVPVLENTAAYFRHGVFDPWDLLAIGLGTGAAYLTLLAFSRWGYRHVVS